MGQNRAGKFIDFSDRDALPTEGKPGYTGGFYSAEQAEEFHYREFIANLLFLSN